MASRFKFQIPRYFWLGRISHSRALGLFVTVCLIFTTFFATRNIDRNFLIWDREDLTVNRAIVIPVDTSIAKPTARSVDTVINKDYVQKNTNFEVLFTKWIIPHPVLEPGIIEDTAFPGWHILVPRGYIARNKPAARSYVCLECIEYNNNRITHGDKPNETGMSLEKMSQRMAPILFAIKRNAREIILSNDLASLRLSMHKLTVDTKPDGVAGLEFIAPNLTLDSYHFHHRSSIDTDPLCKYRIRKKMRPLLTTAIRCRSKKDEETAQTIMLDEQAPPVFASEPKFRILGFEETLFQYEVFWAMFSAFSPVGEASIWGLWAQRLIQEMNAEVGLVVAPCPMSRQAVADSSSSYSAEMKAVFLTVNSWSCPVSHDILNCSLSLAEHLDNEGYVKGNSVKALHLWLEKLRSIGYRSPPRHMLNDRQKRNRPDAFGECIVHNPALVVEGGRGNLAPYKSPQKLFPAIEEKCKNVPKRADVTDPFQLFKLDPIDRSNTRDIALIIIFNWYMLYGNIIFLEELYRNYFNQIIYCGAEVNAFAESYTKLKIPVSFIEIPNSKGVLGHDCVARAMMMNYDVRGYMHISDDVLLNTWTIGSLPRDRFWFQKDLRIANRFTPKIPDLARGLEGQNWPPWSTKRGKFGIVPFNKILKILQGLRSADNKNPTSRNIVESFFRRLEESTSGVDNFVYSPSDIFYVPTLHRREWIFLCNIFVENGCSFEVSVPTMMSGIDKLENIVRLDGDYLWYDDRVFVTTRYRASSKFLHPYKFTDVIDKPDTAGFLCFQVLPHIVNDLVER